MGTIHLLGTINIPPLVNENFSLDISDGPPVSHWDPLATSVAMKTKKDEAMNGNGLYIHNACIS